MGIFGGGSGNSSCKPKGFWGRIAAGEADSHRMGANRRAVFWQWLHLGTAIKQNSHLL